MLGEIDRRAKLVSVHIDVFGRELPWNERAAEWDCLLPPSL